MSPPPGTHSVPGELTAITGVCPVLSAAFHPDGSLDLPGFRRICSYVASCDVESVMVFGIATENAKLSDDERSAMLEVALDECHSRGVRVVATTADHSTELAVQRVRRYEERGVDVVNVLPSYFLNPDNDQVRRHLSAILEAVTIPVIIQSLPMGGNELPLADIVNLHNDYANLLQIKVENIPSAGPVAQVLTESSGAVTPLVGWGGLEWREAARAGAVGVQPGCSLTELYVEAQKHLDQGDDTAFDTVFEPLRGPLEVWMRHPEVLIAVEKHILQRRGVIDSPYCRHPSADLSTADLEHAERMIHRVTGQAA